LSQFWSCPHAAMERLAEVSRKYSRWTAAEATTVDDDDDDDDEAGADDAE